MQHIVDGVSPSGKCFVFYFFFSGLLFREAKAGKEPQRSLQKMILFGPSHLGISGNLFWAARDK